MYNSSLMLFHVIHVLVINYLKNGNDILSTFFASNNSTNELNLHFQNGAENRSIWKKERGKGARRQDLSQESEFSFKYFSRFFSAYRTHILKYIVESLFKFIQPDSNFSFYRYTSVHHPSLSPLSRAKCGYSKNTSYCVK